MQPGEPITRCVSIDITDDSRVEGEHGFTVEIASASPPSVIQCTPNRATIHILDDDSKSNAAIYTVPFLIVYALYPICDSCICTVGVVGLAMLPASIPEEVVLSVCTVMSGPDYLDIPLTVNFTLSSEQGSYVNKHRL